MIKLPRLLPVAALLIPPMTIATPAAADEYVCRTDYRNSGLSPEQIDELCREEATGGTSGGSEPTEITYPNLPGNRDCTYSQGKCKNTE